MKTVDVVAAVIREKGRVFVTQRGYGIHKDRWEFPGGKIEPGETPQAALVREIQEELNTLIEVEGFITTVEYDYPEFHLNMACFWAKIKNGHLELMEHEAAKWLCFDELEKIDWLPADWLVVEKIMNSNNYDEMNLLKRGEPLDISFNSELVPTEYTWSGYVNDVEEFKKRNFLQVKVDNTQYDICSSENGVGLGEYLSRYIFKQDYIYELENMLSPDFNFWFFRAWEQCIEDYSELDSWIKRIVEMLIDYRFIIKQGVFFVLNGLSRFEGRELPSEIIDSAKKICEEALYELFEENGYENIEELPISSANDWIVGAFRNYLKKRE